MIEFTLWILSTLVLAAFVWSLVKIYKLTKHTEEIEEDIKQTQQEILRFTDQYYRQREDDRRDTRNQMDQFERYIAETYVRKAPEKQVLNG
jgi:hypothetical protein